MTAEDMLYNHTLNDSAWTGLVEALNRAAEAHPSGVHWMPAFYRAHGYHTCLTFHNPGPQTVSITTARNIYTDATGNDDLRCNEYQEL